MKDLRLNTLERMTLLQAIPQGGTLAQVATYLRILEVLRLKEDEQKAVGWQAHDNGTATVQDALQEFDISLEDADFAALAQRAGGRAVERVAGGPGLPGPEREAGAVMSAADIRGDSR